MWWQGGERGGFDLICNAQRRCVGPAPYAPASFRHERAARSLIPTMPSLLGERAEAIGYLEGEEGKRSQRAVGWRGKAIGQVELLQRADGRWDLPRTSAGSLLRRGTGSQKRAARHCSKLSASQPPHACRRRELRPSSSPAFSSPSVAPTLSGQKLSVAKPLTHPPSPRSTKH